MNKGGKLYYVGAGTSGRLGVLDASECPPTFGVEKDLVIGLIAGGDKALRNSIEDAEDNTEAGAKEITEMITKADVVVGIAASGSTPYVIGAMEASKQLGAYTVAISCKRNAPLSTYVDCPIELDVGPEVVQGSTRLKAGTAQKMVLNMISTTTMIKLGKVYGDLMINVQATNDKLRKRLNAIVREIANVDTKTANQFIELAGGDPKMAILMNKYQLSREEAQTVLTTSKGHLRKAMQLLEN
ncbi:N-acetylmuramic acid 6-phosphate etherase [Alkalihalobacillus sp. MEB130]|uniref:N-acetylmuramic acid 6-phosphate etherase n=1 Tax=Alkalihalobacillus sp. MEB130 TaxID=2976704 RepID=UPI0028E04D84|nr:N-acetylmuramic acid 6-phosphate etherase [Alkalihalobacillus sp. MEB130]MDT8860373.1 N-acetylmuramic acid 6-phosphate etherase [Alkalihalobacillus sp. MEB130]